MSDLPSEAIAVLGFWFQAAPGPASPDGPAMGKLAQMWFGKSAEVDREVKERFTDMVRRAQSGELEDWKQSPRGTLALIILLDQFPRHIFRNDPRSFSGDSLALAAAQAMRAARFDLELTPAERFVAYLPLMHAEDPAVQKVSRALYRELKDTCPDALRPALAKGSEMADLHADIIERFGRYPHRNAILSRTSTQEEIAFLESPNSSF